MLQHLRLDQFITEWLTGYQASGKTIFCKAGCSGCCSLAVHATLPEAAAVTSQLSQSHTEALAAYVKRLQDRLPEFKSLKDYLKQHREQIGPCPFLSEAGLCGIYPVRPLSCRALLSTRPADWCSVDFSQLEHWDKVAFESGLDQAVVAWPTQYVAATQEFAGEREQELLRQMRQQLGWTLAGNFATLVWLEGRFQLSKSALNREDVLAVLSENRLDNQLIFQLD